MRYTAIAFVFMGLLVAGPQVWHAGPVVAQALANEGGGEGEKGGPHPDFEYMEMKPMVLPVITDKGVTQQISLVVSLEVPYGKKAEVENYEPRLTDAYLQDLYGALGAGKAMVTNNVIDVQAVKARLTNVTRKVLKDDQVHDVLLQVLQQRRMM